MSRETLPIFHLDEALVAVHKPSGLLVHRSDIARQETRFAVQILRDQLGRQVTPLHRLDRGTSGVLLFAFDPQLNLDWNRVDKAYLAVVRGHAPERGEVDHPLAPPPDPYAPRAPVAQSALTRFERLATTELPFSVDRYPCSRYSLLRLEPVTGRRHQLRRHMKHIAHPIIGDATYGKGRHNRFFADHLDAPRLLLACVEMCLPHPLTGQPLRLTAPLNGDFASLIQTLHWQDALPAHWLAAE